MRFFRYIVITVAAILPIVGWALADEANYPRPELLLEPAELAKEIIVLDARPKEAYEKSHVLGARWVDHEAWSKGFGEGGDAAEWSRRIGELGISDDSKVVVYDDSLMKDAARIWWILRYWGVADVRLLNGGWKAYNGDNLPTTDEAPPAVEATAFKAQPRAARLVSKDDVLKLLKDSEFQIIDARSEGEFCGTEPGKNKRGGAIPGAKHLEWSDLVDKETSRFKSAKDIAQLFEDAGIDLQQPAATHCQSGGRASVMAFGLELIGAKDVRNYYKGWSEWGNAEDTPVEPGKRKKG